MLPQWELQPCRPELLWDFYGFCGKTATLLSVSPYIPYVTTTDSRKSTPRTYGLCSRVLDGVLGVGFRFLQPSHSPSIFPDSFHKNLRKARNGWRSYCFLQLRFSARWFRSKLVAVKHEGHQPLSSRSTVSAPKHTFGKAQYGWISLFLLLRKADLGICSRKWTLGHPWPVGLWFVMLRTTDDDSNTWSNGPHIMLDRCTFKHDDTSMHPTGTGLHLHIASPLLRFGWFEVSKLSWASQHRSQCHAACHPAWQRGKRCIRRSKSSTRSGRQGKRQESKARHNMSAVTIGHRIFVRRARRTLNQQREAACLCNQKKCTNKQLQSISDCDEHKWHENRE